MNHLNAHSGFKELTQLTRAEAAALQMLPERRNARKILEYEKALLRCVLRLSKHSPATCFKKIHHKAKRLMDTVYSQGSKFINTLCK